METRLLKAFIVLAEELNFRKAADRLNMSQPPLTRLISQMEFDLGVPLFTRTTRTVELTGAGLHLLKRSRDIIQMIAQTELEVRSLHKKKSGVLEITFNAPAIHSEIPRLLSSFKEQFPKIKIAVNEFSLVTQASHLKSGKLDIAFGVNRFKDPLIHSIPIQTKELGLMISNSNPLSKKKVIQLNDLNGETLIFHGKHEHLGFQEEFLDYLTWQNVKPQIYYKKSKESCGELVANKKGLLLSSKYMGSVPIDSTYVPLSDCKPKLKVYAHYGVENPSISLKAYLNFLRESELVPRSEMDGHLS